MCIITLHFVSYFHIFKVNCGQNDQKVTIFNSLGQSLSRFVLHFVQICRNFDSRFSQQKLFKTAVRRGANRIKAGGGQRAAIVASPQQQTQALSSLRLNSIILVHSAHSCGAACRCGRVIFLFVADKAFGC